MQPQALRATEGGREGPRPHVLGRLNSGEAPGMIPKVHVLQVCTDTTLHVLLVTLHSTWLGTPWQWAGPGRGRSLRVGRSEALEQSIAKK